MTRLLLLVLTVIYILTMLQQQIQQHRVTTTNQQQQIMPPQQAMPALKIPNPTTVAAAMVLVSFDFFTSHQPLYNYNIPKLVN